MNNKRRLFYYILFISSTLLIIISLLIAGKSLNTHNITEAATIPLPAATQFLNGLAESFSSPLSTLLLQIVTILLVARVLGYLCTKIGQPRVIGEILAGIALGPSLLGNYLPEVSGILFPKASLGNLGMMSQLGLLLFMFIVGLELDFNMLKNKASQAVVISHASIVMPFMLGVALAYFIYEHTSPAGVNFTSYALFLGISMSITAFPVLVRILKERGLDSTPMGTLAITCAAADDITAWCILAAVVGLVKAGSMLSALYTISLSIIYVLVMLKIVRPILHRSPKLNTALCILILLLSGYCTELIGIHALFGAFMAGVIMPNDGQLRDTLKNKIEDVAMNLLLPLFFVFTGLRTQIGLLNGGGQLVILLLILLVAITGKFLGSALAARAVGQNWRSSLTIGALMNTRGLMELVALNIGYELGVITPQIFTMLVLMAIITTCMTGPALKLIDSNFKETAKLFN
ncbi:cation:proton antiporter [Mucilaginibacter sp. JRF]|uniref:cation:proton antiporter domain-containing protein n=1 Tax=Mucilaginibacter sp. JRF TaxID=2780088 RepID=UPI0018809F27|nr:cation:proton antiporter [Mucilaginibacter sp. JRF]MBE9583762.1 cation:proton antiporter [Mucilaginibacter sp. JRF]